MQRLLGGAKTIVDAWFQGSQEVNTDAEARDTTNGTGDSQLSPSATQQLGAGAPDVGITTVGRKRSHAGEGEQVGRKRVQRERAPWLLPDYNVQRDAARITVPDPREDLISPSVQSANMNGKQGSGSFKFRNTLNQQPHAAQAARGIAARDGAIRTFHPQREGLALTRSKGINVPPARELQGDGFRNPDQHAPKRRKGNDHYSISPSQEVDLTKDNSQPDYYFGEPIGPGKGNGSMLSSPLTIDDTIAAKVGKPMQTDPERRKRKPKISNTATPGSARTISPVVEVPRLPLSRRAVYRDRGDEVQFVSASTNTRTAHDATGVTNGYRNGHPQKRRRSSVEDLEFSDRNMHGRLLATAKDFEPKEREHERNPSREKRTIPQTFKPPRQDVPESAPLAGQFVRLKPDSEPSPQHTTQPRPRASQRMQATSNGPGRRESSSEDELAGRSTVPSIASREVSPQKQHTGLHAIQKHHNKHLAKRPRSPTDLVPTQFIRTGRDEEKKPPRVKRQEDEFDEEIRIPVKKILCRSCCLLEPGIVLVWENEGFMVEFNGRIQQIPNKEQLVFIGKNEVAAWIDADHEGVTAVQIKGSITPNSNGNIIIEFEDSDGLSDCFSRLFEASKDSLRSSRCRRDRMLNILNQLGATIIADSEKNAKANAQAVSELALMQVRKDKRQGAKSSIEEQIQYDQDEISETRQSRRSQRMQSASSDQQSNAVRSKHFTWTGGTTNTSSSLPRTSTRATRAAMPKSPTPPPPVRWTQENKPKRWSQSVIYPQEGAVRRVTVDFQDLERLDEGEFLNDNIIGFALRQIEESMRPEHKEKVLFFNSFFYTALTTKSGKKAFNYDAVKRWTKHKDVFSYQYIVVPINIDLHWFVMIICNLPNLSRKPPDLDDDAENEEEMLDGAQQGENETIDVEIAGGDLATQDAENSMHHLSLSDDDTKAIVEKARDVIETQSSQVPSSSRPAPVNGTKSKKKKTPPKQRTFDTETPTIMSLDSFGRAHSAEIKFLKDYLSAEAKEKRGMTVESSDLQGMTAKGIPEQPNFCDCGVYLVRYLEEFAKNPKRFVNKVLRKELDEKIDFANFDPSDKRAEIRNELLRLQKEQDPARKHVQSTKESVGVADTSKVGGASDITAAPPLKAPGAKKPPVPMRSIPPLDGPAEIPERNETLQDEATIPVATSSTYVAEDDDLEQSVPQPAQLDHHDAVANGPPSSSSFQGFATDEDSNNVDPKEARSNAVPSDGGDDLFKQLHAAAEAGQQAANDQPLPQGVNLADESEDSVLEIKDSQESRRSQPRAVQ